VIEGIKTTIPYQIQIMNDPNFVNGNFDTKYLETTFQFNPHSESQ
jgi:acetyl-CoA carboxylase biotin carboxylase subunit